MVEEVDVQKTPSRTIILICALKCNIQKRRSSEASFFHLFGENPPPSHPDMLVFPADAALGFTQELQKTALQNILHLFHRATVRYSSRSRHQKKKKGKRNRK